MMDDALMYYSAVSTDTLPQEGYTFDTLTITKRNWSFFTTNVGIVLVWGDYDRGDYVH